MSLVTRLLALTFIAALGAACGSSEPDLSGRDCDAAGRCVDGWQCNLRSNKCIPEGESWNTAPQIVADDVTVTATGVVTPVVLDASATIDAEGDSLHFLWKIDDELVGEGATPTVNLLKGVHEISVEVTDGFDVATATITVKVLNATPVAVISSIDRTVSAWEGAVVELDGRESHDPDGDTLTHRWVLVAVDAQPATPQLLSEESLASVSLEALQLGENTIILEVTDGEETSTAETKITVQRPPVLQGEISAPLVASRNTLVDVRLVVENTGGAAALNVEVGELDWQPAHAAELIAGPDLGALVLAPGDDPVTITWTVRPTGAAGTTLVFRAGASGVDANDASQPVTLSQRISDPLELKEGPALTSTLHVDPTTPVVRGDNVQVELQVTNTGLGPATEVTPPAELVRGEGDVGELQLVDGPAPAVRETLAAGQSVTFRWTYATTRAGRVNVSAGATAIDPNGGVPVETGSSSQLIVIHAPVDVKTETSTSRAAVNEGQTFEARVTVRNDGDAPITSLQPSVYVEGCGTCVEEVSGPVPAGLATLNSGSAQTFRWTFRGLTSGTVHFRGESTFLDEGQSHREAPVALSPVLHVQREAALVVDAIGAPAEVTQGQDGAAFEVTLRNDGEASAHLTSLMLHFAREGTPTTGFTATLVDPFTVEAPLVIAGGDSATVAFRVDVSGTATGGQVEVRASGTARDTNTDDALEGERFVSGLSNNFQVREAPNLKILRVESPSEKVSRGQEATVSVFVRNDGGAAASASAVNLTFTREAEPAVGFDFSLADDSPVQILPGVEVEFVFDGTIALDADKGTVILDAEVVATDVNGGDDASASGAQETTSWLVQDAGRLEALGFTPAIRHTTQGHVFSAEVEFENAGEGDLSVEGITLVFRNGSGDVSSSFAVDPEGTFPMVLAADERRGVIVNIAVAPDAPQGDVDIDVVFEVVEVNSAEAEVVEDPAAGRWKVQAPPALVVEELVLPSEEDVIQQRSVQVRYVIRNTGEAVARVSAAGLAFTAQSTPGHDANGDYTVTTAETLPVHLGENESVEFTQTVAISSNALAWTPIAVRPTVVAVDVNSDAAVSLTDPTNASWTVLPAARLHISRVVAADDQSARKVSQGQQAVQVFVDLENPGTAAARVDSLTLTFRNASDADRGSQFAQTVTTPLPVTLPESGSGRVALSVNVNPAAVPEALVVGASVSARQVSGNELLFATGPAAALALTVQTPPSLQVTLARSNNTVSKGQEGAPFTIRIRNNGQADARVVSVGPKFTHGTAGDVSLDFNVTAGPGNQVNLPGGSEVTWSYTAEVAPWTPSGTVTLDAAVTVDDLNGGPAVSLASAQTKTTWFVQEPPQLRILAVRPSGRECEPGIFCVSRGQPSLPVEVDVRNTGGAVVNLENVSLRFLHGTDVSAQYTVQRTDGIQSIPGQATAKIAFTVAIASNATTGSVTVNASATGSDANSGAPVSVENADEPGSLLVQAPAVLEVLSLEIYPSTVVADDVFDRDFQVQMEVRNAGDVEALGVLPKTLTVEGISGGTAQLVSGPTEADRIDLWSNQTALFNFTYRALTPCGVRLRGRAGGNDANSGHEVLSAEAQSNVVSIKVAPIPYAGADQTVFPHDRVYLDGTGSQPGDCDPGSSLEYSWWQESGDYFVGINNSTTLTADFDAEQGAVEPLVFTLEATAFNPQRQGTSEVSVQVRNFRTVAMPPSPTNARRLRKLAVDAEGRFAAATLNSAWFHDGAWFKPASGPQTGTALSLAGAGSNRFWFGFDNSATVHQYTVDWTARTASAASVTFSNASATQVRSIAVNPTTGDTWFATRRGLWKLDDGDPANTAAERNPAGACDVLNPNRCEYYAITIDSQQRVFAANDARLFRSGSGDFGGSTPAERVFPSGFLPTGNDHIRVIARFADELWIGSEGNGIAVMRQMASKWNQTWTSSSFTHLNVTNSWLPSDYIRDIFADARGHVWVVTDVALARFIPERNDFVTYYGDDSGLPWSFDPHAVMADDQGGRRVVAVGADNGLFVLGE